jgi:UPF0755 protein
MKRVLIVVGAIVFIAVFASAYGVHRSEQFMNSPMHVPADGIPFEVRAGSSFSGVSNDLVAAGLIVDDFWFRLAVRRRSLGGSIQAGDYHIAVATTPEALLQQFIAGTVRMYSFTLVEGWNYREVLQALHAHDAVDATMSNADWQSLLQELGSTAGHPEGLFLPETYKFPRHTTDKQLLTRAFELMQNVLAEEWQSKAGVTGLQTPYDALVLASIVEKETARADERAKIAGVFIRRLQIRMRLQTDPTVIYGLGPEFDGNLTRVDLRTDTPYNTYTRHGLPPTPIAMPGRAAINAALHPVEGESLFFVATGLGDGSHLFSATKAEHDAAVAEYLQRLRQRRRSGG